MPQSIMLEGATSGEVRISPDGALIYEASPDGVVRVSSTLTGELLNEWQIGGNLGPMDIDPSGSIMIIFDTQQPVMYYVDLLRFGQFNTIPYELGDGDGLISDIAIFTNGTALVIRSADDGGFGELQTLNVNLGTFAFAGSAGPGAFLSRASIPEPFAEHVLVSEPGIGAVVYDINLGPSQEVISSLVDATAQAIGGEHFVLARPGSGISVYIVGSATGGTTLRDFDLGTVRDMEFSINAEFLYVLGQSGSTIFTIRTSDWSLIESFSTGTQIEDNSTEIVTLLVDPRGQFFTIETGNGFVVIENPGAPDITGTGFPDQIVGTLFGDVIFGLGSNDEIDAGNGADIIHGGTGFNRIEGGSNVDTIVVSGNLADYTITQISSGRFEIASAADPNAGGSLDDVTGIEFVQFDDQTMRLLPGTGVSVNFETSDPSVYQGALEGIRDFDGNDLGGDGSWLRIGSADVNGDGDIDQILVNDAIGRFATVGTAPDGLVYFEDHGWAGETRVAGIYIDPLVQSGDVVAGGANDSQRRFQNDLEIENINRVLGANDYDGDGIWEVYFALTDGTAYLRALMHEDGNIRYANYQSEQEVIDYLTANGFDDSTYGDWFTTNAQSDKASEQSVDIDTFTNVAPDASEKQALSEAGLVAIEGGFQPHASDIEALFAGRPFEGQFRNLNDYQAEFFG